MNDVPNGDGWLCPTLEGLIPLTEIGPLSAAIMQLTRSHRLLAGLHLRPLGLHPFQELVMLRLWEAGRQRQIDLAQYLDADAATVTRSIQRLTAGGFVRCQPSPADKRATIVEATPASSGLQTDVRNVWEHLESIVTADLTPTERNQAHDLLQRILIAIDAEIDKSPRRIANQAFFDRIPIYELEPHVDATSADHGEPFDILFNPELRAVAVDPEARLQAGREPAL
jgi:DNA-binding MarR family transcriptional regulator